MTTVRALDVAGKWCVDERHGTPCPQPCAACADECSGVVVDDLAEREGGNESLDDYAETARSGINDHASPGAWAER
jgi:hypothetical protein